jgi:hypothetical protein
MSGILSGQGGNAVDWYILNQAVKGSPVGNAIPWVGTGLNALSAASYAYDFFANGNQGSLQNTIVQGVSVGLGVGASGAKFIWGKASEGMAFSSDLVGESLLQRYIKINYQKTYEWATPAISSGWDLIGGNIVGVSK